MRAFCIKHSKIFKFSIKRAYNANMKEIEVYI